jgi:hypothetical protein
MKTKTYSAFRIDVWDGDGNGLVEHLAGLDDYAMAVAAYEAAVAAGPLEMLRVYCRDSELFAIEHAAAGLL